jgi:hypothetical protein
MAIQATYLGKPVEIIHFLPRDDEHVRENFVRIVFPTLKHRYGGCLVRRGVLTYINTPEPNHE